MRMKSGCFLLPSYGILIPAHYRVALARPGEVFPLPLGSRRKTGGMSSSWWAKRFCAPWQRKSCCTPVLLPTFQVLELAGGKTELTCTYQAVCSDAPNAFPQGGRSVLSDFSDLGSSLFMPGGLWEKGVCWWGPAGTCFSPKVFDSPACHIYPGCNVTIWLPEFRSIKSSLHWLHCSRWHDLGSLALKIIQASFTKNFQTPAIAFRCSFWVIK